MAHRFHGFGGLPAGNYTARTSAAFADFYDVLPGRRQSARLGPADGRTRHFAVYAYTRTASISGVVFNDQNGDGKRNSGEPAVAQIRVFIDENENGVFDGHEPTSISTHTGRFNIAGVRSGWNLVDAFDSRNAFYNSYAVEPYVQVVDGAALEQRIALWRW